MCHNVSLLLKSKSPSAVEMIHSACPCLHWVAEAAAFFTCGSVSWCRNLDQDPSSSGCFYQQFVNKFNKYNCQLCLYADKSGVSTWTRTGHTIMCLHVSQLFSLFVIWNVIRFFRGLLQKILRSTCYCKQIDYQVSRLASLVLWITISQPLWYWSWFLPKCFFPFQAKLLSNMMWVISVHMCMLQKYL